MSDTELDTGRMILGICDTLRSEAMIADRPGSYDRLNEIANDIWFAMMAVRNEARRFEPVHPNLDERYEAADAAELGDQLRPDELTARVKVELANAFSRGALWQYARDTAAVGTQTEET